MQKFHEMSMPISAAKARIEGFTLPYIDHIIRCVVFNNTTNDLIHWENEIATYISKVNDITVKPKAEKFSKQFYVENFFLYWGDEVIDYNIALFDFQRREGKYYPNFEITDQLSNKVFEVVKDFSDYFSVIVSAKNSHTKQYFLHKIVEYFDDI